jgi:hypothetical protein
MTGWIIVAVVAVAVVAIVVLLRLLSEAGKYNP